MFGHWLSDVIWDARYNSKGLIVLFIEALHLFLLICAASCIEDVYKLEHDGSRWWWFCVFNMCSTLIWVFRYLEIATTARESNMRLEASTMVESLVGSIVLIVIAFSYASSPNDDGNYYPALLLLILSTLFWPLRMLYNALLAPPSLKARYQEVTTPLNVSFMIHRVNEFTMLMLGETVLQLVIAPWPEGTTSEPGSFSELAEMSDGQWHYVVANASGLIIVLVMLHSHVMTFPQTPERHGVSKGVISMVAYFMLLLLKSMFLMAVGIGVKIVLYEPDAQGFTDGQLEESRLFLGLALCCVHLGECLLKVNHEGFSWFLSKQILSFEHPRLSLAIVARLSVPIVMLALCNLNVEPWVYILIQAALSFGQSIALAVEDYDRYHHLKQGVDHHHA